MSFLPNRLWDPEDPPAPQSLPNSLIHRELNRLHARATVWLAIERAERDRPFDPQSSQAEATRPEIERDAERQAALNAELKERVRDRARVARLARKGMFISALESRQYRGSLA